jgi:hypothetical protein
MSAAASAADFRFAASMRRSARAAPCFSHRTRISLVPSRVSECAVGGVARGWRGGPLPRRHHPRHASAAAVAAERVTVDPTALPQRHDEPERLCSEQWLCDRDALMQARFTALRAAPHTVSPADAAYTSYTWDGEDDSGSSGPKRGLVSHGIAWPASR